MSLAANPDIVTKARPGPINNLKMMSTLGQVLLAKEIVDPIANFIPRHRYGQATKFSYEEDKYLEETWIKLKF